MSRRLRLPRRLNWLNHSLVRFVLVGGVGELLYLGLFALAVRTGAAPLLAILIAGGICLLLNAVLHARISFRVAFRWRLLLDYLLIQALCLLLTLGLGWLLERRATPAMGVAIASLLLWSGLSFGLTRWRYRRPSPPPESAGLASRQTSHSP